MFVVIQINQGWVGGKFFLVILLQPFITRNSDDAVACAHYEILTVCVCPLEAGMNVSSATSTTLRDSDQQSERRGTLVTSFSKNTFSRVLQTTTNLFQLKFRHEE